MDNTILEIAYQHLGMQSLETANNDGLDFHDLAVWNIRSALEAAYKAGQQDAAE